MADTMKVGSLAMRAVLKTIERGEAAQRAAGNEFTVRADTYAGPKFAAAAEELREMGIARITRHGFTRFYTLTPGGKKLLSTLGDTRIGGSL